MCQSTSNDLRILFLEDSFHDVELISHKLKKSNFSFISKHVDDKEDFITTLHSFNPDIILADYSLAGFNGIEAFDLLKKTGKRFPFILVTGSMTEAIAMECLKEGIDDFILKSSLRRLPTAILNAIKKRKTEDDKIRMSDELKKTQEELRMLLGSLESSREDERKRISREIHDELGQVLTVMKIEVSMLRKKIAACHAIEGSVGDEFKSIIRHIDSTIGSVKRIATELRPEVLDHIGIIEAVKFQAKEFETKTGIICKVNELQKHIELNTVLATTVYRIAQEALTNIARHANASSVNITIGMDARKVFVEVCDNGKGISDENKKGEKSLGLIGMRERVLLLNGTINITGKPKGGTVISVKIPA